MDSSTYPAIDVQTDPSELYVALIPGHFLLDRTTPSWRIDDPMKGFQRTVNEKRARTIAADVIDQGRTFPNAIVLATNRTDLNINDGTLSLPDSIRFLVVDGQHRLWAQRFAEKEINYVCMIHPGLEEAEMAELFVEINDNQKRVPASLRWDLVRLTRSDDDPHSSRSVDLVYELTTDEFSPLFQRIDLTGEDKSIILKQASLAPELRQLVKNRKSPLSMEQYGFEHQHDQLIHFFQAIRNLDPEGWTSTKSTLYQNRVIRALLKLLPEIVRRARKAPEDMVAGDYEAILSPLDLRSLDAESIRGQQGSAGITQIRNTIAEQLGGGQ